MPAHEIVLGNVKGTFWTGRNSEPWLPDPREAKVFAEPREAWQAATDIQDAQTDYLEGAFVELHVRDRENPQSTRWVTSLAHADTGPSLRTHWQQGFGEALPPDLPIPSTEPGRVTDANEIIRDRDREAAAAVPLKNPPRESVEEPLTPDTPKPPTLPPFVTRHFVRTGDQFYYRQKPEQLAFITRGETFRAEDVSASVAIAMVEIAQSRGWSALRVKGSKEFRRLVWATATKRGLSVEGYSPSAGERATLDQDSDLREAPRNEARSESRASGRERPTASMNGVLVDHGVATYHHQQGNSPSYYVSLREKSGDISTYWGVDLERAISESGATVGDEVQLARLGRQRVQVREPVRNAEGFFIDYETREVDRNAWSVTVEGRGSSNNARPDTTGKGHASFVDPIASQVVELFTSERLAQLAPEDRARFRMLYDQAKARLEAGERLPDMPKSFPNEISRHRDREHAIQGR